ncbi:secretory phospholipase A2 receptor-like [Rana temporaria]|uniref:secretory phospholipase A2 receptor-like n=1 Tax=Rana temporaria TaxID=8407 RepID=UPI001AAD599E|nr:secretory phospholipase A2 receptor-like [Rana temporaria]
MTPARSHHTLIGTTLGSVLLFGFFLPSSPADSTSYSPDLFVLESRENHLCISVNKTGLFLSSCEPFNNDTLWKWGTGQRLYNLGRRKCLGLDLQYPAEPLAMVECDSDQHTLSWQCNNGLLIGVNNYKLAAVGEKVIASKQLLHKWRGYGSFRDNLCDYNFQEIFTLNGNSRGKPCVFPFKFQNSWFHECTTIGKSEGMQFCATTVSFDKHKLWGYCPTYGDGCGLLWEENTVTHSCYQFNLESSLSWNQARDSCQAQGGDLLSITNLAEHEYISKRLVYTGLCYGLGSISWIPLLGGSGRMAPPLLLSTGDQVFVCSKLKKQANKFKGTNTNFGHCPGKKGQLLAGNVYNSIASYIQKETLKKVFALKPADGSFEIAVQPSHPPEPPIEGTLKNHKPAHIPELFPTLCLSMRDKKKLYIPV